MPKHLTKIDVISWPDIASPLLLSSVQKLKSSFESMFAQSRELMSELPSPPACSVLDAGRAPPWPYQAPLEPTAPWPHPPDVGRKGAPSEPKSL